MKVITEQYVRDLLKEKNITEFRVESDKILSPAAKDYLNQERIRVCYDRPVGGAGLISISVSETGSDNEKHYIDAQTGEVYSEKPECMTHIAGNRLVYKDHKRIAFRGTLDHLQSQIVFAQASLCSFYPGKLIDDLENALAFVRELVRAEVRDEPVGDFQLLGLDSAELRKQSHNPDEHFGIKAMTPPHYEMGDAYAHINLLRTLSRRVEVMAVKAFRNERVVARQDIVQALNRLSSGFHIICCRLLSGYYDDRGRS